MPLRIQWLGRGFLKLINRDIFPISVNLMEQTGKRSLSLFPWHNVKLPRYSDIRHSGEMRWLVRAVYDRLRGQHRPGIVSTRLCKYSSGYERHQDEAANGPISASSLYRIAGTWACNRVWVCGTLCFAAHSARTLIPKASQMAFQ